MAAMFAALICVATIVIQIPSPIGGFLNFGDCFILIAAWTLGPLYGCAAGAVGSAMADIITGYAVYAPATFVIKGLIGLTAAVVAHKLSAKGGRKLAPHILSAAVAEVIMVTGYFLYDLRRREPFDWKLPVVTAMGRHSLLVYLAHQPVIYGVLAALDMAGIL